MPRDLPSYAYAARRSDDYFFNVTKNIFIFLWFLTVTTRT